MKGATPFLEFRLDRLLAAADLSSLEGRARAAERAAALIAEHPNDLVRDQYVMKLAGRLDIDPDRLRETGRARARASARRTDARAGAPRRSRPTVDRRELDALRWAVQAPELMSGRLDVELFADPLARSAFDALTSWPWHECLEQASPEVAALLQRLAVEDPDESRPLPTSCDPRRREPGRSVKSAAARVDAATVTTRRSSEVKSLLDALANARTFRRALGHRPKRSPSNW